MIISFRKSTGGSKLAADILAAEKEKYLIQLQCKFYRHFGYNGNCIKIQLQKGKKVNLAAKTKKWTPAAKFEPPVKMPGS